MPHRRWVALIAVVLAGALAPPAGAVPSSNPDVTIGANGPIFAMARQGDRVISGASSPRSGR